MSTSLAEVTTVQHNMSTVSHSYDDLGAVLKEKISELESTLSNMQNIQRESNSMMEWLQNMDTAAAKWEATLIDSEAVKEQVDQHKVVSVSPSVQNYQLSIINF